MSEIQTNPGAPVEAVQLEADGLKLLLPAEHIRMRMVNAKETYLLAARGTFKTSRAIPLFLIDKVHDMPRSTGVIVGLSFDGMADNTINPMLRGLSELGYFEGVHYVFGKKPPADWPKPYLPVINDEYKHVMTWYNGTSVHLVSLARKASANGVSAQWGIFDEVKFMDEAQLVEEIFPIFRGNEQYFRMGELDLDGQKIPVYRSGFLSKLFCTDKEADPAKVKWLFKKRNLVDPDAVAVAIAYKIELDRLQAEFTTPGAGKVVRAKLRRQIDALELELAALRAGMVYVAEVSIDDVAPLMSKEWYRDKQRNATAHVWKTAYLNQDPERVGDSFYPYFEKELHTYSEPNDIVATLPLIITPDYQASVAPITVAQLAPLPGRKQVSLNYVDEVYTLLQSAPDRLFPNGNGQHGQLAEAVQLFCDRYRNHAKKVVYYIYDHTAIGERVNSDKYWEIVVKGLRKNRWRVVKIYTGLAPGHYKKFQSTSTWLKHSAPEKYPDVEKVFDPGQPLISINRDRCPRLITSVAGAGAKSVQGKTQKDKAFEDTTKYPMLDQSETTHFSDCFDMTNHAVLEKKKIKFYRSSSGTGLRS